MAGVLLLAGCVSVPQQVAVQSRAVQCEMLIEQVDASVQQQALRNPRAVVIEGVPWLRANRFAASFPLAGLNERQRDAWWQAAVRIGTADFVAEAQVGGMSAAGIRQLRGCIQSLAAAEPWQEFAVSDGRLTVPDSYNMALRWLGLYPLSSLAATPSINSYRREMTALMRSPPDVSEPRSYFPGRSSSSARALPDWTANALGVPSLSTVQWQVWFDYYAPVITVGTKTDDDRIGTMTWQGDRPVVNINEPQVYTYLSFTRFSGDVYPQLNYAFWFPARSRQSPLDLYAGELDGLIWRVTLNSKGQVAWFDSIHQCGCYHKLYLPQGRAELSEHIAGERPVDLMLPPELFNAPVELLLRAADHYLVEVTPVSDSVQDGGVAYRFADYQQLHALPAADGFRSMFNDRGLVPVSKRPERFTLWPLGIESAGAMRQRGQHPTAFIGHRHFDDPFLFETLLNSDAEY